MDLPPTQFVAPITPVAQVQVVDPMFSTSSVIYMLWGKEQGDKMIKIFTCESGMKQWADYDTEWSKKGEPLMSSTTDIGIAQIHIGKSTDWLERSKELGYDLTKTVDNLDMAYYIWNIQGFGAWSCSKKVGIV